MARKSTKGDSQHTRAATPEKRGKAPKQPPPEKRPRGAACRPKKWTTKRIEEFLAEIRRHGRLGAAAKAVGTSRRNIIAKRERDPAFDQAVTDAWEDFREQTIANVQHHAWEGEEEPIVFGGEIVGHRKSFNTKMMELEAKRVVPEYRDKLQLSGDPARPIKLDLTTLTTEELQQALALAEKATTTKGPAEEE